MIRMSPCRDLEPEELLLAQLVRVAIRDARQAKNVRVQEEARWWLWEHAPAIAARAGVTSMPIATDNAYSLR